MIALVGDQPLPNFLPVKHYKPSDVLLIYTAKTQQKYEYLKVTLQRDINVYGLEADPYDIPLITRKLHEELDKMAAMVSQALVFNLTGGTKTMSLAAYQVARQRNASMIYLQSEGKHTRVYHYIWEDEQLRVSGNELLPECITLQNVFDLHLGPGNWQECGSGRREGSPFEDALANVLRLHGYEVMVGVSAMSGQIDVDIAVRASNQYGIIEAKMGRNGAKLDGIKQLSNAARHLGTYSQTFYVITVPPQPAHTAITEASNIQVISIPGYDHTTYILPLTGANELLSKVGKTLRG
jgi:hypothetical protein